MKKIVLILTAALTLTAITGCSPKKETVMIKECIFPGDYPDPTIIRDGKDFYMTHSSFTYYPGLLVWHSTDLINWEPVARAVQGQDYSIFAPELCKVGDKYIIYYPTSNGENFVVTADKIEGPWSDPVKIAVSGIDPGHVIDTDGSRYLYTNMGFLVKLTEEEMEKLDRMMEIEMEATTIAEGLTEFIGFIDQDMTVDNYVSAKAGYGNIDDAGEGTMGVISLILGLFGMASAFTGFVIMVRGGILGDPVANNAFLRVAIGLFMGLIMLNLLGSIFGYRL